MPVKVIQINCRRLWRIWNFFLILSLYTYLTYDSICRYIALKRNSMDLAFGSIYCPVIMNIYLMSIIVGLTFITLSLYCLVCNNGNYGDDGIRLGRDTDNIILYEEAETINNAGDEVIRTERKDGYLLRRFKRNFLPFSCLFHYLSAMCFLIPMPFVESHQIRQRVLSANNLWHSDLDFIFDPDNWHKVFVSDRSTVNWILRPQYFNLILSLVSISVRYASVFWTCHRGFSFIFSLLMMLSSLHILLDYSTTSILIHIAYNPDFISESLKITVLPGPILLATSFVGSTIILVTFWCIFEFGFQQFAETLSSYRHIAMMQSESSHDGSNTVDINCCKKKHLYLRGYLPHVSAVFGGVIGIGMKFPLYYVGINIVYKITSDPMVMTNFLISIIYICVWLITWFGFSLKPTWSFTISNSSKTISDISSTTTTVVQPPRKQSFDQNNQVYTCFHNLDSRLVMDENSLQNRSRNRDYYSDEADFSNNTGCTNYVYLQSTMNPAHNPMIIPQSLLTESPLMTTFIENSDQRNIASDSDSSYDSAINIRNQLIAGMDPQIGRSQSQTLRNFGVLKYSGGSLRSHTPEYIPFQNEGSSAGGTMKFENCSSPDTSTLHAAESDTTLKSNPGTQVHAVSLNRQNSNKKRTFGQRVTFKDDQSPDVVECSPNNSELSSNNTNSSDSGIDSNSKHHRYLQTLQTNSNFTDLTDTSQNMNARSTGCVTSSKCTASTVNNTQFGFDVLTSNQNILNAHSQNSPSEDLLGPGNDEHSMSYVSEEDQEQRLCSQV